MQRGCFQKSLALWLKSILKASSHKQSKKKLLTTIADLLSLPTKSQKLNVTALESVQHTDVRAKWLKKNALKHVNATIPFESTNKSLVNNFQKLTKISV